MASVSDITVTPLSGLNHIDALLDKGPDWNFLTSSGDNVLYYTFSTTSGNEAGRTGQEMFSTAQQAGARTAFSYLQQLTGIEFRETGSGGQAQFHLANLNLDGAYTTGLCSWISQQGSRGDTLTTYNANAYVYLDNAEWRGMTQNLISGSQGYETLLHELGHALGLKHPFLDGDDAGQILLPASEDNTGNTLMSYDTTGIWYSTYRPYDVAALNWLYGGDGLRGALGMNSTGGRFIVGTNKAEKLVGTSFNDILQGNGGSDMINGGEGFDTTIFNGNRNAFNFSMLQDGSLAVTGTSGTTTLQSIEMLQFADMAVSRASLSDTTPPAAPQMAIAKNAAMYSTGGARPLMNGSGEANSTIKVYVNDILVATTTVSDNGLWSAVSTVPLADGLNYRGYALAIDAAGNISAASQQAIFHVDATPPSTPTMNVAFTAGGNQPVFSGTGDSGTTIELYRTGDFIMIASATVGTNGTWKIDSAPLPNGVYNVIGSSVDVAGNAASLGRNASFTVNNAANVTGSSGTDKFVMQAGNSAVDGGAGIDTAVFSGARSEYKVVKGAWGHAVSDASGGIDGLYNVERLEFSDSSYAIDEGTAQVFRLYQASLGRASDAWGLGYWIDRADKGASMRTIAEEFLTQKEFYGIYGEDSSNEVFLGKLYENVLHRQPDAEGFAYWMYRLTNTVEDSSRAQVMLEFSESIENKIQVYQVTSSGMEFEPWKEPVAPTTPVAVIGTAAVADDGLWTV
jgi:serralysin